MSDLPLQLRVGEAIISLCTLGTLRVDLAAWLPSVAATPPPGFEADFAAPISMPVVCAHIALPDTTVVVDCCLPEAILHSVYAAPGYRLPPTMPEQLRALGLDPAAVEHVVFTHSHFDHICGAVESLAAPDHLAFPNATHYLGAKDWERIRGNLANLASLESRSLGLAERAGRLRLTDGPLDLGPSLRIIPAPGETPGHQIVRVHAAGETLYIVGDLYHHPVEVAYPWLSVHWADGQANLASRSRLAEAAQAEGALLAMAHLYGLGRLRPSGAGVSWEPATDRGV